MPSVGERLGRILFRSRFEELDALSAAMRLAYEKRPYLLDDLTELNQGYYDYLRRHVADVELTRYLPLDENERLNAVRQSRILYSDDPITHRMVGLWTDFGFGQNVEITPTDGQEVGADETDELAEQDVIDPNSAKGIFHEFWTARRNAYLLNTKKLHRLSDILLVDGELFFVFFISTMDGECTIRRVATDEITDIITDPDDKDVPLWYRREFTRGDDITTTILYYPDWQADEKELGRGRPQVKDDGKVATGNTTEVVIMHLPHNTLGLRGWPMIWPGAPWVRAYKNFMQDRAALARSVATMVRDITTQGGSRAVEFLQRTFQSSRMDPTAGGETNPPPIAGSDYVHNQAVRVRAMPLTTAAGDATQDGASLMAMAGISMGIYPHWLGRGEAFRLATAVSMEPPILRQFNRYQEWWAATWREVVDLVLSMREKHGKLKFATHSADVSLDPLIEMDLASGALALRDLNEAGLVPAPYNMRKALELLGFKNIDEIIAAQGEPANGRGQ